MNLIKIKTAKGWVTLYKAMFGSFLSKDKNLADVPDKGTALKNLGLTGDVTTHNHDSRYMPIINEKYEDLANKIKDLEAKLNDQKHNFFSNIDCSLSDFSIQPNGWYIWKGTISGVTGTWLIRKAGSTSCMNYMVQCIEDPRVTLNSNNLSDWYSPYGYWHA